MDSYDIEYAITRFNKRGKKYNPDLLIFLNVDFLRIRELMDKEFEDLQAAGRIKKYNMPLVFQSYIKKNNKEKIINYQTALLKKFINEN